MRVSQVGLLALAPQLRGWRARSPVAGRYREGRGGEYRCLLVTWLVVAAAGSSSNDFIGGPNLLQYFVLALGGALVVGNTLALIRPPAQSKTGELTRPPIGRSITMIVVGLIAAVWAIATLTS